MLTFSGFLFYFDLSSCYSIVHACTYNLRRLRKKLRKRRGEIAGKFPGKRAP